MSRHDASIADQEATEHFEDGMVRAGGDEVTDEHSQGVFDEIDLDGSLAPAAERTHSWTGETSAPNPRADGRTTLSLLAGVVGLASGVALVGGLAVAALAVLMWLPPREPAPDSTDAIAVANAVLAPATRTPEREPVPELRDVLVLRPIAVPVDFAFDSYAPITGPRFDAFAGQLRTDLQRAERSSFTLVGHTDSTGSAQANRTMGLGRAWAVEVALIAKGFADQQIALRSAGEDEPIADNRTAAGRAQNRRVVATFE